MAVIGGYSTKDTYSLYKEKCVKKGKTPLPLQTYLDICHEYNRSLVEEALRGSMAHLPFDMGSVWVKKREMKFMCTKIDYKIYNETGLKVYHMNDHSDGYTCHIRWDRIKQKTANMSYYRFLPTREFQRNLAQILKQKNAHKRFFK